MTQGYRIAGVPFQELPRFSTSGPECASRVGRLFNVKSRTTSRKLRHLSNRWTMTLACAVLEVCRSRFPHAAINFLPHFDTHMTVANTP